MERANFYMSKKRLLAIAGAVVGIVGLISWWPKDEPVHSAAKVSEPKKAVPRQARPQETTRPQRVPGFAEREPPVWGSPTEPAEPPNLGYPGGYAIPDASATLGGRTNTPLRFRPLSERERERQRKEGAPAYPAYTPPGYAGEPSSGYAVPTNRGYGPPQGYGFRPPTPAEEPSRLRSAPYPVPEQTQPYSDYGQDEAPSYGPSSWPQTWAPSRAEMYPHFNHGYDRLYSAR
jgi:hypothetical protein